ncbi:Protein phosphatase 1 regulatory subunit 36 [Nibea albiflora]|uniref:Protein phosphatase 1 regulatory subunit 36 n=1 Tax=Nibea albiflora TaxID=240163 RepID=A0ACB7ESZ7_NIBAL|nr:Protein phosphatase 1 regulatory subunit 36 [Nibea albiflora]
MPKDSEEQRNVCAPPAGRWVWNDEARTVEFVSSHPAEEATLKERRQTNVSFHELNCRSEWSKKLDEVLMALLLYLSCFFEQKSLQNKPKTLIIFFCYVAWVTFGRKDLRDIQEEVGRLLYSDTFNTAVRNRTDVDSGVTFATVNGSVETGEADPQETGCNSTFRHRLSQRCPALSSIVNQRSPLLVSLLPSPKERSAHLFSGGQAKMRSPLQAEHCDTKALMEELNQQLASVSFGILGRPLTQFRHSTLIPYGQPKNNRDEADNHEAGSDVNNNSEDRLSMAPRSSSSFIGPKLTGLARYGSTAHNTRNSAATIEVATSDAE